MKFYARVLVSQMLISHYGMIVNSKLWGINDELIDGVDQWGRIDFDLTIYVRDACT